MAALTELFDSNPTDGRAVFVTKFVPGFDALEEIPAGSGQYLTR